MMRSHLLLSLLPFVQLPSGTFPPMLTALRTKYSEWLIPPGARPHERKAQAVGRSQGHRGTMPLLRWFLHHLSSLRCGGSAGAHAQCPACGFLERHRLMWLFIQERTPLLKQKQKLLHVAPERFYFDHISDHPLVDYTMR